MRRERKYDNGRCPECGGDRLIKAGFGYNKIGRVQKYMCKDCRLITIKPIRQLSLDEARVAR